MLLHKEIAAKFAAMAKKAEREIHENILIRDGRAFVTDGRSIYCAQVTMDMSEFPQDPSGKAANLEQPTKDVLIPWKNLLKATKTIPRKQPISILDNVQIMQGPGGYIHLITYDTDSDSFTDIKYKEPETRFPMRGTWDDLKAGMSIPETESMPPVCLATDNLSNLLAINKGGDRLLLWITGAEKPVYIQGANGIEGIVMPMTTPD